MSITSFISIYSLIPVNSIIILAFIIIATESKKMVIIKYFEKRGKNIIIYILQ